MNELAIRTDALPVEALSRLQAWAVEAKAALADATQRAYAADSRAFADWCAREGRPTLPAQPEAVAAFLRAESEAGKAVATIRRRASTISRMHKAAGLASPCGDELVRLALKGISKARGTDQRQAAALTGRDADTIRAHLGDSLRDIRDLALMLVGRDLLARASELVAITVEDIEQAEDGALVSLRRRKTSTEARPYFIGSEAAEALQAWLERAAVTTGPVFRSLTSGGRVTERAISTRDVRRILKGRASKARLSHAQGVSGHSLRVGMAQDLVAADLDVASVMQAGGWTTPRMVARYSERITARRGAVARYYGRG
jgi:site-specific recombinase XerD